MRYWTSDHHFGHHNIIDFANRPFPDVDSMNQAMIDLWNDTVDDSDEVVVVGDFAMGVLRYTVPLAKKLKGHKTLVPGNHDSVHRMYPKWKKNVALYEDAGFTILNSQVMVNIGDTPVLVCHFPYTGDSRHEKPDRFSGLRPTYHPKQWLIHGHTHSRVSLRDRQIHVGVDSWDFKPVSDDTIAAIIKEEGET